ncbi:hypothetical protein SDJN02_26934, partial [Cucurbita argyrosperma subsp. argyrosperma]
QRAAAWDPPVGPCAVGNHGSPTPPPLGLHPTTFRSDLSSVVVLFPVPAFYLRQLFRYVSYSEYYRIPPYYEIEMTRHCKKIEERFKCETHWFHTAFSSTGSANINWHLEEEIN